MLFLSDSRADYLAVTHSTPPAIAPATEQPAISPQPTPLPGKGLRQHPFLYTGEWDTRKPLQTIFIVRDGKVVWTYSIPIKNENGELNEFDDIHLLSNGHVLFARKTGATEITQDKRVVWNYDAPPGTEIHSAQPIGKDKVLFMQNGNTLISGNQHGYVREVDPKGQTVWEINKDDLPGFPLQVVQEVDRLANGNSHL